jgi:predicted PolB exonuclease-like 3'-5' exonuclease
MFSTKEKTNIIALDIETVPKYESVDDLLKYEPNLGKTFLKKAKWYAENEYYLPLNDELIAKIYNEKAGLFAEYGKIIVISCGGYKNNEFKVISFYDASEYNLLNNFLKFLSLKINNNSLTKIIGYNIMNFDIPYIVKRCLINDIKNLPQILQIYNKKPWDLTNQYIDLFLYWQMGIKNYASFDTVVSCFDIDTPKDVMDGSDVRDYYYNLNKLDEIKIYCEKDVIATSQLFEKFLI